MLAGNLSHIYPDAVKLRLLNKNERKNANVDYFIVNHFLQQQQQQQLHLQIIEILLRIAR